MPFTDLRDYLERLEKEGELTRVRVEVDPAYEIGAICRKVLDRQGPALLFEHPRGHTMPVAVNLFASRRRYGLALETTPEEMHREWTRRLQLSPLEPIIVKDAPCKEHIILGDQVDLTRLPIPIWNELDGGPYITLPTQISKDPESGSRNAAMYRSQVFDRNTIGILAAPYRHLAQHRRRALERGEPFPVAIALGVDPVVSIASVACFPMGVDELAMAGALRGAPVELVPCETIPLEVPATAEIVLEGEMPVDETVEEGLFGEFTGYYGIKVKRPVIKIKAITHRTNPIYAASYEGRPPQETNLLLGIPAEAEIMRVVPLPGIQKVHITDGGCGTFIAIVSIKKEFEGYGKMIGAAVLGTWSGRYVKILIVVDDDIDPFDWTAVEWALATRVQPHRDVEIIGEMGGIVLDPSLPLEERRSGHSRTSKMIIDATRYDAADFEIPCLPKREIMEQVEREWPRYGIGLGQPG